MKFTEKHDKGLFDLVIKRYENYLKDGSFGECTFCADADKHSKEWMCNGCVLIRRFKKQCFDYPSYQIIDDYGLTSEKVKNRIAVLKRLKHKIKGVWVG